MKASLKSQVVAEGNDVIKHAGYHYFSLEHVRLEFLDKAAKTPRDLACPHRVQFYDVTVAGERYARAAWIYEAPRPTMEATQNRVGFWNEVEIS